MIDKYHNDIYNIILSIIFAVLVVLTICSLLNVQKTVIINEKNK
jgi:hypothetical protein